MEFQDNILITPLTVKLIHPLAKHDHNPYIICTAAVAQLDRASGFGPEGWGFESSLPHFIFQALKI